MKSKIFGIVSLLMIVVATMTNSCKSVQVSPEQAALDSVANVAARQLMQSKGFMFSGEQLTIRGGRMVNVTPNTNFILVEGDNATIQISPGIGAGPNGVGGFTFKGMVTNYKCEVKKSETIVTFLFSSNGSSGDVRMVLYKNSNKATTYINSTFYRGKTQMWGKILPLGGSRIMEGVSR